MVKKTKEILFIVQYPEKTAPSQRFRCELYKKLLEDNGFEVSTWPFLNKQEHVLIYKQGFFIQKSLAVLKGFFRRTIQLTKIKRFSYVFILREASPLGPPVFEWIYSKILKRKIIYDFDDAIWIPRISEHNSLAFIFKNSKRVRNICKWSYKVSCGNQYLLDYAKQYNSQVVYNPSCVDTQKRHNILSNQDVERITIGWTGSFSTLAYLNPVIPVLISLQEKYDFDIKIICNKKPAFLLKNQQYVEWSEENEVRELAGCQIGLMPLSNDEWSIGKCGFKLIQYLSLQIPAIASPIGVNSSIIEHGVNGFLCHDETEWYNCIENLIIDAALRKKMGIKGRKKIIEHYSLESNKDNFLNLFK